MNLNFKLIIYLAVFLLSSPAFGRIRNPYVRFANGVADAATECGDLKAGHEAMKCVLDGGVSNSPRFGQPGSDVQKLSQCLAPVLPIVATCGKDNYVTILEILRYLAQNLVQLDEKIEEIFNFGGTCPIEENEKANLILKNCLEKKSSRKNELWSKEYFDEFCLSISGYRACHQEIPVNNLPEGCGWQAYLSLILGVFDGVENGAENSATVKRCLNKTAE